MRPVILNRNPEPTIRKKNQTPNQQTLKDCLGELNKHVSVILLGGRMCVLQLFWSIVTGNHVSATK